MKRRPPRSTRTDTLLPYTTLFRSTEDRPISREVAIPEPMPVEIAPEGELLPFMLYLNEDNPLNTDTVFLRGALFADGRMDLCKRSEEHTSELQSLMRISYAVFCLKKKK